MVIVRLMGGLGNQLFQYAAGRRLAEFHQTALKLDITQFKYFKDRAYYLSPFSIQEQFASAEEITKIRGDSPKGLDKIFFQFWQKSKACEGSIFSEKHVCPYNPDILKTPENVYLDGYWQSEKYFKDIEDNIRKEFDIQYDREPRNMEVAKKISETDAVSVHVRRCDYVSDQNISRIHGALGLDYYYRCVELISKKISNPHFFVFSDDSEWVVNNLKLGYPTTFVTHNTDSKNYNDLSLMACCNYHIIANSSFSWWGAWLSKTKNKIVYGPKNWFNKPNRDTRDLIPEGWLLV